jgi:hypothetical protein
VSEVWLCPECANARVTKAGPCTDCLSERAPIRLQHAHLDAEDLALFIENLAFRSENDVILIDRWISELAELVSKFAQSPETASRSDIALFWLRLHGAIVELPERSRKAAEMLLSADPKFILSMREDVRLQTGLAMRVHLAADGLRKVLDEDEHLYADWRRQTEAHLTQSAYGLRMKKDGPQDSRYLKVLGKTVSIRDVRAALGRVRKAHATDHAIAAAFAAKLAPSVKWLAKMQALYLRYCKELDERGAQAHGE